MGIEAVKAVPLPKYHLRGRYVSPSVANLSIVAVYKNNVGIKLGR